MIACTPLFEHVPALVRPALRFGTWGVAGALVGVAAWGEHGVLWVLLLLPIAVAAVSTRREAFACLLGYYLAAARGLPAGAAVFFGAGAPSWLGWSFWLGASVLLAVPYGLLWSPAPQRRAAGFVGAVVLVALPPLGLIGWCNPLAFAGLLLPGSGWIGVLGALLVTALLAAGGNRRLVLPVACVALALNWTWAAPKAPADWRGFDTDFSRLASGERDAATWDAALQRVRWIEAAAAEVPAGATLLLPETLLGPFGGIVDAKLGHVDLALAARGARILVGAEVPQPDGRYINGLVVLGKDAVHHGERIVIRQGLPVPVSMWKPFGADGAVADLWGRGSVLTLGGERPAALICYEQLLTWPMLLRAAATPTVVLAASNLWWARDTSIPAIEAQTVAAYARLFGWPVVSAVNS